MLSRIGRVDFFAVLPAGFYILVVFVIVFQASIWDLEAPSSLWDALRPIAVELKTQPGSILFILFGSYLCGSLLRATPVRWIEYVLPPFKIKFPHSERLKVYLETLRSNAPSIHCDDSVTPIINDIVPMDVFNYWKNVLCINSPDAFRYYQAFEAKSRFFSGMFWAGLLGTIGGVSSITLCSTSHVALWHLLIVSVVVVILFGSQFRRVRCQEATALVSLYTAYRQTHSKTSANNGLQRTG